MKFSFGRGMILGKYNTTLGVVYLHRNPEVWIFAPPLPPRSLRAGVPEGVAGGFLYAEFSDFPQKAIRTSYDFLFSPRTVVVSFGDPSLNSRCIGCHSMARIRCNFN